MKKWSEMPQDLESETSGEEAGVEDAPEELEEVISDMEAPAAMREYAAEQEKMADAQFELLREFQQEEREAFASVEASGEKKESLWQSRMKKGMMGVTAGMMLMMAIPAFAEQPVGKQLDEPQRIEQSQEASQFEKNHKAMVEETKKEVEKHGNYNIMISYEANEVMKERGWRILQRIDVIEFGNPHKVLTLDENTKKVNIGLEKDGDIRIIVEDKDGTITIVTVNEKGDVTFYNR
ncbi:hypothetical protein HY250_03230 [Candidatus Azambacteria bacterium]|nr:hypothetical protein [Candidatus Azambacteria bacterium]